MASTTRSPTFFGSRLLVATRSAKTAGFAARHMLWTVARAVLDIGVDWTCAEHRDADIGALQFVLRRFRQRQDGVFAHRIRSLVCVASLLKTGARCGIFLRRATRNDEGSDHPRTSR